MSHPTFTPDLGEVISSFTKRDRQNPTTPFWIFSDDRIITSHHGRRQETESAEFLRYHNYRQQHYDWIMELNLSTLDIQSHSKRLDIE